VAFYATSIAMNTPSAFATYRQTAGLTLDATADLFGVDRTTILRWERGKPPIPERRLSEVSRITGIPPHELRPDLADIFLPKQESA